MRTFALWCERRGLGTRTIRQYSRQVADFEDWLAEHSKPPARACTWRDVRRYAETRPNTYPTRSALRSALVAFYRCNGKRDGGHAWAVPLPKRERGRYRGFDTDEQKDRLLEAARSMGPEVYAMCCALYYQALRREEASQIRWSDITPTTIKGVGKMGLAFERELHPRFVEALGALTPRSPWVFPGRWPGTHASPATVWMKVRLAGERAGLGRVTPHMLRHTSGAKVNDTVGLRTAAEHLRHRDIQTTMIYSRTTRRDLLAGYAAL